MTDIEKLIKLINIRITGRIIEIALIVTLLGISIPLWNSFESKMSTANIMTLNDYKMETSLNSMGNIDYLKVENNYYINKNYRIILVLDKNVDLKTTEILINDRSYYLDDFYSKIKKDKIMVTLVDRNLVAGTDNYKIEINSDENIIEYRYIFEENNNF